MNAQKAGREQFSLQSLMAGVWAPLAAISGVVNVLALTGSFYMLQVYDRVLTSRNVSTLIAISILAACLYGFSGALEVIRAQVLVRVGDRIDRRLMPAAQQAAMRQSLRGAAPAEAQQAIRDVDSMRAFLASQGAVAIFDLPWLPLYILFIAALHPVLGLVTAAGALVICALTLASESVTRTLAAQAVATGARRQAVADENARNVEVMQAMGFADRAHLRFAAVNAEHLKAQESASDIGGALASISRVFRMMLQSAILGLGAYLTIRGHMTAGAIIAASLAAARALAPIELAAAHWRGFIAARQARARLTSLLNDPPGGNISTTLPAPSRSLRVEHVAVAAPRGRRLVLSDVNLELKAGQGLGVIGPSAAGKSCLARTIAGAWSAQRGAVRLDGASFDQWTNADLGRHIGYLPQTLQLFEGTIAQNISRFEAAPASDAVIEAARAAGIHDMVLKLPSGYDTPVGVDGGALSAGQRQRIGLARALFRKPFLVVLDEPNSNLDSDGDMALIGAMQEIRLRGGIVIVVAHRPNILTVVDTVCVIAGGRMTAFGPRDEVLQRVMRVTPIAQDGGVALPAPVRQEGGSR
jgi:PrtD family type I secretion system ABC transporter